MKFEYNSKELSNYFGRIARNLPQMIVCSIQNATFTNSLALEFNKAIKNNEYIEKIDVSDSEFKDQALNLFLDGVAAKNLNHIILSTCKFEKCFDKKTIGYLANKVFEIIDLSRSKLSSHDKGILMEGLSANSMIKRLDLDGCLIGGHSLKFLTRIISTGNFLTNLNISGNDFSQDSIDEFFSSMEDQKSITNLNFSGNIIVNIDNVLRFMKNNSLISHLDLSFCGLTDGNLNSILQLLQSNKNLVYLELEGNAVSDRCLKSMKDLIEQNKVLKYIGLPTDGAHEQYFSESGINEILEHLESRADFVLNLHPYVDGFYRQ